MLDQLGLGDPNRMAARLAQLSTTDLEDLRFAVLDIARPQWTACLRRQAPLTPTAIWAAEADPAVAVGATLLWAGHYLSLLALANCRAGRGTPGPLPAGPR